MAKAEQVIYSWSTAINEQGYTAIPKNWANSSDKFEAFTQIGGTGCESDAKNGQLRFLMDKERDIYVLSKGFYDCYRDTCGRIARYGHSIIVDGKTFELIGFNPLMLEKLTKVDTSFTNNVDENHQGCVLPEIEFEIEPEKPIEISKGLKPYESLLEKTLESLKEDKRIAVSIPAGEQHVEFLKLLYSRLPKEKRKDLTFGTLSPYRCYAKLLIYDMGVGNLVRFLEWNGDKQTVVIG